MSRRFDKGRMFRVGITVYTVSALTFFLELIGQITGYYLLSASWIVHEIVAIVTLVGFVSGGLLIWRSYTLFQERHDEIRRHLRMARGEFFEMINVLFDQWALSPAERDVALLTVKGLTVSEIAELRSTSEGTVKSQNNSIYKKAGVSSRTQLLGILIEDLLVDAQTQPDRAEDLATRMTG